MAKRSLYKRYGFESHLRQLPGGISMTEAEKFRSIAKEFKNIIDELIRQWRDDLFTAEEILTKIDQVSKAVVIPEK